MDRRYVNNLFGLTGQVVVVTGGGGVLGGVISKGLARAGARLVILDVSFEAARKVAEEIVARGGEAMPLYADVLSRELLEKGAGEVMARFGAVDVLLNCAGGNKKEATTGPDLSFFDLPRDAIQSVLDLNFVGTLLPVQVFGRHMAERGEGIILNVASVNAFTPLTKIPAYSAAKAAIRNFTEWLAVHVAQNYSPKIRVNAIAPGFFLTQQNRYLLLDEATGQTTPRGQIIIEHTPLGRYGDPEELISTVLWLLSPASTFVHGVTVPVDGGFTAFSGV